MSKEWYGGFVMGAGRTVLLLDMLSGSRASYAPGPGVEVCWFLSILALSLASSKAALAAAGVCVARSQQQGKDSGEAYGASPGLACMPLAEFWGLKFMEAGMAPPASGFQRTLSKGPIGKFGRILGNPADSVPR